MAGSDVTAADIAAALRAVLPQECVLERTEERRPYECDGLTAFRELAAVVVLPRSDEEVRATHHT